MDGNQYLFDVIPDLIRDPAFLSRSRDDAPRKEEAGSRIKSGMTM